MTQNNKVEKAGKQKGSKLLAVSLVLMVIIVVLVVAFCIFISGRGTM